MDEPAQALSLGQQIRSFARPFWAANIMEIIERFAYYGVRVVVPIYIASSEDPGGLHFSNTDKGTIFAWWAGMQTLVPLFTGGFADKYGRKPTIAVAITLKIVGYLLMATQRTFWGFFIGCLVLAAGTAVFKPGVQGTLVRGTTRANSSVGWGIFYQVVNIGGWLGPPLAGYLKGKGWSWVFFGCAAIVSLNYLMLLTYRDPVDAPSDSADPNAKKTMVDRSIFEVLQYSLGNFFSRPRLLAFVGIVSGFYLMFMQLYDSLPNFIEEWVDSSSVVRALPAWMVSVVTHPTPRGIQLSQEWMINLDSTLIVLFMVPIAYLASRMRRLVALVFGTCIATGGLLLAGMTASGAMCLAGIAVFAVGEMMAAPKVNEYLGVIAPKGEEALYMGYANMPTAIGWISGSKIAGALYDRYADKANLAKRYLVEEKIMSTEAVDALKRADVMTTFQKVANVDAQGATTLLWDRYSPQNFWWFFVAMGVVTAFGMVCYAQYAKRWTTENA